MQSNQKNIRTSEADNQPDVSMSFEQLMEELDREHPRLPDIEPGDLTRKVYAKSHGCSDKCAAYYLDGLVKQGILVMVEKRSKVGSTVAVYRKAE